MLAAGSRRNGVCPDRLADLSAHDLAGTRYSPLKQIDTTNVTKLVRAWTYHMSPGADRAAAARRRRCSRGDADGARPRRPWRRRRRATGPKTPLVDQRRHVSDHGVQPRRRARAGDRQGNLGLRSEGRRARTSRPGISGPATTDLAAHHLLRHFQRQTDRAERQDRQTDSRLRQRGHRGHEARRVERAGKLLLRPLLSAHRLQERRDHRRARAGRARASARPATRARGTCIRANCVWTFHSVPRPGETGSDTWERRRLEESFRHQRVGHVHHRCRTRHPLHALRRTDHRLLGRRPHGRQPLRHHRWWRWMR